MENIKEEVEEVVEDIKEVVEENIEVVEVVVEDIKEEIIEDIKEEVVKPVTLAKMNDLLKAHIPKKNTLDSFCRTMEQVYGYFKVEDIHELLSTKENNSFIKKRNMRAFQLSKVNCVPCIKYINY
jgi:hypothetical protein